MYLQQRESENYFLHLCYALILSFANIGCWPSPGDIHPREYRNRDVMIEIRHIASGYPKTQGLEGVGALLEIESVGELVEAARRARLDSVAWLEVERPPVEAEQNVQSDQEEINSERDVGRGLSIADRRQYTTPVFPKPIWQSAG
jgi:hypothetical protein